MKRVHWRHLNSDLHRLNESQVQRLLHMELDRHGGAERWAEKRRAKGEDGDEGEGGCEGMGTQRLAKPWM